MSNNIIPDRMWARVKGTNIWHHLTKTETHPSRVDELPNYHYYDAFRWRHPIHVMTLSGYDQFMVHPMDKIQ